MPIDRGRAADLNEINENEIVPYAHDAVDRIDAYYSSYSKHLNPLSDYEGVPQGLVVGSLSNGDKFLHKESDQQELVFDVIVMVVSKFLETPLNYSKAKFPHFRRWIKVTAAEGAKFTASIEASKSLYNYLGDQLQNVYPGQEFLVGGTACFRPSVANLTSLDKFPDATPVDFPPHADQDRLDAIIRSGHGKYIFSSENEVLFMKDIPTTSGAIERREVGPGAIRVGQIVQVRFSLRLLKQERGFFTRREVLKGVYILNDGVSHELARKRASARKQNRNRKAKSYTVQKDDAQDQLMGEQSNA